MNINIVNQNFGARIFKTTGAKRVERVLDKASIWDYSLTNYIDYKGLCERINDILPSESDSVSFNKVQNLYDEDSTYRIYGNLVHNGKNKKFGTFVYCTDGSFATGNRIINAIKKACDLPTQNPYNPIL